MTVTQKSSPIDKGQAIFTQRDLGDLMMLTLEERHEWLRTFSPANLRLVAAVRGYEIEVNEAGYAYAMLNCGDGESLIALAASNPEGVFFGFDGDAAKLEEAAAASAASGVDNVKFVQADTATLAEAVQNGALQPAFNYIVANLVESDGAAISAAVTLASNLAAPGALCYACYPVTPVKADSQTAYIMSYQAGTTNTDKAQTAGSTSELTYLGSAKIRNNYLEFSVHPDHQPALMEQHGKPVYENLKDMALGARLRHDVWIKPGARQNANAGALLAEFNFGIAAPSSYLNPQFRYFGKKLDLTTPLFARLLATLSETTHTIGDLLSLSDFQSATPEDVLSGLQVLIATGIVEATRGGYNPTGANFDHPQFAGSYNQRLRDKDIGDNGELLAAPMLGRPVLGTAPMLKTMQSMDQSGLRGAEEALDQLLLNASPGLKKMIGADLEDKDTRRNTSYRLLEQMVGTWLQFCYVNGILQPA